MPNRSSSFTVFLLLSSTLPPPHLGSYGCSSRTSYTDKRLAVGLPSALPAIPEIDHTQNNKIPIYYTARGSGTRKITTNRRIAAGAASTSPAVSGA